MTFEQALTSWLKQQPGLVALLWDTARADVRVSELRDAQNTAFPKVTWSVNGRTRWKALDGTVGVTRARVRFEARGATLADAQAVAAALRTLDGFGPDWMAGVWCQACLIEDDGDGDDDEDPTIHAGEAGTALVTIQARITFTEP